MKEKSFSLLKPSELWPGGLVVFLNALRAADFEADSFYWDGRQLRARNATEMSAQVWQALEYPQSHSAPHWSAQQFAFASKFSAKITYAGAPGLLFFSGEELSLPFGPCWVLCCKNADAAFDFFLKHLKKPEWVADPQYQNPSFQGVQIEPGVVIGPDTHIGEGTIIEQGVRIGARVRIGRHCRVGASSRIADGTQVGDYCDFSGSVVLGSQGFGFVLDPKLGHRVPRIHVGRVVIGNNVRLGAFCAVDRGVIDDTCIGDFSALDNIVQIAHNCEVGSQALLCSFVGLSGSTRLGNQVTIAGMVGTKGHVSIGDKTTIAAQTGVSCDIGDGETVKGYPPRPLKEALEIQVLSTRLPKLFARVKELEKLLSKK